MTKILTKKEILIHNLYQKRIVRCILARFDHEKENKRKRKDFSPLWGTNRRDLEEAVS